MPFINRLMPLISRFTQLVTRLTFVGWCRSGRNVVGGISLIEKKKFQWFKSLSLKVTRFPFHVFYILSISYSRFSRNFEMDLQDVRLACFPLFSIFEISRFPQICFWKTVWDFSRIIWSNLVGSKARNNCFWRSWSCPLGPKTMHILISVFWKVTARSYEFILISR